MTKEEIIVIGVQVDGVDKAGKEINRFTNSIQTINKDTKMITDQTYKADRSTGVWSKTITTKSIPSMKTFRMEALGLLFGGMAIERSFGTITKAGMDLWNVTELINETMGVAMLPMMDLIGPVMFDVADSVMQWTDKNKDLAAGLGIVMLAGQAFGAALSGLGQSILFIQSLKDIGGLGGLFTELANIINPLKEWIGKTLTTTWNWFGTMNDKGNIMLNMFDGVGTWLKDKVATLWDWTASVADTIWKFISSAGEWLWSGVKTVVSFLADTASTIWKLISSAGVWLVDKAKTIVEFTINTASTVLKWFSEKGTWLLDKAKSAIQFTIDAASATAMALLTWLKTGPNVKIGINFDFTQALQAITMAVSKYGGFFLAFLNMMPNVGGGMKIVNGQYVPSNATYDEKTGKWTYAAAEGGIFTRPTNALIGEAGPEAVIPLDKAGSLGGTNFYNSINIYNPTIDSNGRVDELARKVADYIGSDYRRLTYR